MKYWNFISIKSHECIVLLSIFCPIFVIDPLILLFHYSKVMRVLRGTIMTSSNGNIFHVTGPWLGEFTSHRWIHHTKPVTRSFDVFLIFAWTNVSINNRTAGDWRRHRIHYDATVMTKRIFVEILLRMTTKKWFELSTPWRQRLRIKRLHISVQSSLYIVYLQSVRLLFSS